MNYEALTFWILFLLFIIFGIRSLYFEMKIRSYIKEHHPNIDNKIKKEYSFFDYILNRGDLKRDLEKSRLILRKEISDDLNIRHLQKQIKINNIIAFASALGMPLYAVFLSLCG